VIARHTSGDLKRCEAILARYPAIGFVDASLAAMAERRRVTTIATTDRQHFSRTRPVHADRFTLVP
jgi:predicted nucleic acid-binding protein